MIWRNETTLIGAPPASQVRADCFWEAASHYAPMHSFQRMPLLPAIPR